MSDLRAKFLAYNPFRERQVTVLVPSPEGPTELTVIVKQPSVEERNEIFAEAKVSKDGGISGKSGMRAGALAIVYCVRNPENGHNVFSVADLDTLMHMPANTWVDELAGKVMEVLSEASDNAKK